MTISDRQFETDFVIQHRNWLDMLVGIVKCDWISNLDMFGIAAKIANHVE